ncbi:C6 transcription factor, putative [Metarhizium acridum CQMa 102]|uniref:C6 transcription factor, putative n=1 Tax=Metarhizium acridum (strain CQMa 102) TaxID=655827 RepID=E9E1X9_METAQ|nr:C6 transcription factor, putative [Metarhizium acridum CQMa 102]EFY90076.1 C6 transcription factor, putative [Metarhizium acridum CQMa 102]
MAPRLHSAVAACTECRKQKTKYQATAHEELFELLKALPSQEAHDILNRIRDGTDVVTILNHVRAGDVLVQMAVEPETRFRYEFPYKSEMPQDYVQNNPYLDSIIFEATSLYAAGQSSTPSASSTTNSAPNSTSGAYESLYLKPFHASGVIEPQLSNAKISWWTTVCQDDVLMRDLLGVFFRCEYHFTAAFQKDLFLEDLVARRRDFCSALLVNIMLAYSCVCYPRFSNRAEYWNTNTLVYRFLAEAKRIWELEATEAHITTIQAGILFNVFHNLCGLDEIGQAYRIQAISLAHQLRLFDSSVYMHNHRMRNGRAFTAWALFNWETLVGFSFLFPPLLKTPPDWPLPDPSKETGFYGEVWVKYPLSHNLSPSYFGQVFKARSEFRIIMNEYCQAAFSEGSQTLVRLYYLRHGFEAMDLFIVIPLMLAGYECIDAISEQATGPRLEALRSTLILIAKGLYNQRRNHYLAEALFRVIRGRMRQEELSLLKTTMRLDDDEEDERRHMAQAVRSHWPVSVVKKKEDMNSHILKNLVETYAHLNVDEEPAPAEDTE